jgi:hypothetical protein
MISGPQPPQSSLKRMQGISIDIEGTKVFGWNRHNILVVSADDDRLSWVEKELVQNLGEKLYGRGRQREIHHG